MHFCDFNVLLKMIDTYNVDEYVLLCGIANTVYELPYGDGVVYDVCYRDFLGFNEELKLLNIDYEIIEYKKLYNNDLNNDKLIFCLSAEIKKILEKENDKNIENIYKCLVPSFLYSSYQVNKIENDMIYLTLYNFGRVLKYKFNKKDLDKIFEIKTIPFERPIYIYKLLNSGKNKSLDFYINKIKNNLEKMLNSGEKQEHGLNKYYGEKGYIKLGEIFEKINTLKQTQINYIYQAYTSGSYTAVRLEFGAALLHKKLIDNKTYNRFISIGELWIKIVKEFKANFNKKLNTKLLINTLKQIEESEKKLFSDVLDILYKEEIQWNLQA